MVARPGQVPAAEAPLPDMRTPIILLLFCCYMLSACKEKTYHSQLALLYNNSVPVISPDSLAQMLNDKDSVLLLDTRSKAEWEVSHLAGARFVDYESFDSSAWLEFNRQTPIVVYCSIGWRSEKIGEKMQQAGFETVHNLYGGVIEWKNNGYPLVTPDGNLTEQVHTYNRYWGFYLTNGIRIHEK